MIDWYYHDPAEGRVGPLSAGTLVPPSAPASAAPSRATPGGKYSRTPLREKRTLPTAAIVLIIAAVLGIPALLILGSVMLAGYRGHAQRATRMGSVAGLANGLTHLVGGYALRTGQCPRNDDPRVVGVRNDIRRRFSTDVRFATIEAAPSKGRSTAAGRRTTARPCATRAIATATNSPGHAVAERFPEKNAPTTAAPAAEHERTGT